MGVLEGKTAFVTGGSSGIGLAIAKMFAAEGCRLILSGRRTEALNAALAEIGAPAFGINGDVADLAFHEAAATEIANRFGELDIYIANAGINTIRHSSEVGEAEYDAQFGVNARGVFFGIQKAVPLMRNGGSIILIGSLATHKVLEGHAVYAGSKAAVGAFARAWAMELRSRSIRVNVLSPGPTDTAIIDKLGVPPHERDSFVEGMSAAIPLGRLGQPNELARAALFLASEAAGFVTGVDLPVDGGMALS